ncbi:MAG: hypothetical protein DYG98_04775 [Haliscomenobacteraceae bacterium CHB4]|nr:hypothetical protein [Haliscomenobacteraceae bacterium CHB4]
MEEPIEFRKIRTQIYRSACGCFVNTSPNAENLLLNMEKKDWKAGFRRLGFAGFLFFFVKGLVWLAVFFGLFKTCT